MGIINEAGRPGPERQISDAAIAAALERAGGSYTKAAKDLGVSRQLLYRRMRAAK